jgi:hypothetical protein
MKLQSRPKVETVEKPLSMFDIAELIQETVRYNRAPAKAYCIALGCLSTLRKLRKIDVFNCFERTDYIHIEVLFLDGTCDSTRIYT